MRADAPCRHRRKRRNDRGQSMTEFALTAPLLILLILGLVDFGRAWNAYQAITDAARLGARVAVVDNGASEQDVRDAIDRALTASSLRLDNRVVTITGFGSGRPNPTTIRIAFDYRLGLVGALLALTTGSETITLTTEIVMQNE